MFASSHEYNKLLTAVKFSDVHDVREILKSGADPNINRGKGFFNAKNWDTLPSALSNVVIPLHVAVLCQFLEIIECLLGFKADVNIVDQNGWTALHYAASFGGEDVVKLLISRGADFDKQKTIDGWTALQWACIKNNLKCVRILLEHGADVALRDSVGKIASVFALKRKESDIVQLLDDFVYNETTAKSQLRAMCANVAGHVSDLNEKLHEFEAVKAELASLKAEMKQLSASKTSVGLRSTFRSEVCELLTLKTAVDQMSASKEKSDQLSALTTRVDQMSASKADVGHLSALMTKVDQLSTCMKADADQLSTLRSEVSQLLAMKTAVEQHANDISSIIEELFPQKDQSKPTLTIDAQLLSLSQRQDIENNWWNIGKELGFSRRQITDFATVCDTNVETWQPAIYKMLQTWCENSNLTTDDEKMREIWRALGKFGIREE